MPLSGKCHRKLVSHVRNGSMTGAVVVLPGGEQWNGKYG